MWDDRYDIYDEDRISREDTRAKCVTWFLAGVGIGILSTLWVKDAAAHTAPTGWTYPISCCASYDCREESDAAVNEISEGYEVASTGEIIPYTDKRVRVSPDGRFHICWKGAKFDEGRVLCIFAPPRAY